MIGFSPRLVPLWGRDGHVRAYALVDEADAASIAALRWGIESNGRATRWKKIGPGKRNGRNVLMHRELMGLQRGDGREVDHINRNPLDNRRANLRIVTRGQNKQNLDPRGQANGTSGIRGVTWCKQTGRWRAIVTMDRRSIHIGRFDSQDEAAAAVRDLRRRIMPFSEADRSKP